jgi:hypothetical protein
VADATNPGHYSPTGGPPPITRSEPVQLVEILERGVPWCEANVMKYVYRWREKNGIEDLRKAKWFLDRLLLTAEEEQEHSHSISYRAENTIPRYSPIKDTEGKNRMG